MFTKGTYKLQIVLGLRTWNESLIKYQSFLLHFFVPLFSLDLVISFVSHEILIIFWGAKVFFHCTCQWASKDLILLY